MAGSSTNQFARLLKRNKPQWPEPEKSIGIFYCKMGRDNSCWEALGAARETLVRAGTQVKTHLDTDSYPTAETIVLTLCMIGRTKETAQPWIMICCKDARCRRRVRKTVEESGILDGYPTVRVGDCSKQPDIDKLLPLAGVTNDPKLSALDTGPGPGVSETDIYYDPSKNVLGTQLYLKDSKPNMTTWKKATAGGIVALDNRYFYMTVAHVFTDEAKFTSGNGSDSEFEFDIGQNDSEDEENELIETTSRASITPEPDDYASSNSSKIISDAPESPPFVSHEELQKNRDEDEAKDQFAFIDDIEKSKTLEAVGRLAKLSTNGPHPDLDYALIEIQRPDFPTFNCIQLSETTFLVPKQVAKIKSQNTSIITATGSSGVLRGILSGTPSFLKSPSSKVFQEVWTVRLDGKLAKGDSGSWVVDSETGALLGHIVAGSPATGVAYVTPFIQIFTDLRTRLGGEFRLPLPTADTSTRTATDELGFIGPDEPVNTKEEVGLLLDESGQHDSGHPRRDTRHMKKAEYLESDSDSEFGDQLYLRPQASGPSKKPQNPPTRNIINQREVHNKSGLFNLIETGEDKQRSRPSATPTRNLPDQPPRKRSLLQLMSLTSSEEDVTSSSDDSEPEYVSPKMSAKSMQRSERSRLHSDTSWRYQADEGYQTSSTVPSSAQGVAIGRGKEQERSISSNISSDSPFSPSKSSKSPNNSWKSKGMGKETTATSFPSDGGDGSESSFEGTKAPRTGRR